MFTGIVTDVGEIASLTPTAQGQLHRMRIACRVTIEMNDRLWCLGSPANGALPTVAASGVEGGEDRSRCRCRGRNAGHDDGEALGQGQKPQPRSVPGRSATNWAAILSRGMPMGIARPIVKRDDLRFMAARFAREPRESLLHRCQGRDAGRRVVDGEHGRGCQFLAPDHPLHTLSVMMLWWLARGQRGSISRSTHRHAARLLEME